jgi:hypothetical protein
MSVHVHTLLVSFVLFTAGREAVAQGPPIHTDTPIMLGLEGRGVRTFAKVVRRGRLLDSGEEVDNPDERDITVVQVPIIVPYNLFSERFQVGVIVPFAKVDSRATMTKNSSSGLADVRVFGKYLLYQRDGLNETFRVATKAGVKFGSGDGSKTPPLGTDSTDYFMSVVAGWVRGRTGIYGEGIVNLNGSNDTIDVGNSVAYNLAFGFRLSPAVYGTYPARHYSASGFCYFKLGDTDDQKNVRIHDVRLDYAHSVCCVWAGGARRRSRRRPRLHVLSGFTRKTSG